MSKNNLKNFIISLLLLFQANLVICSVPDAPPMSISSASPTPDDGSSIPDAPPGDDDDSVPAAPPIAPPLTPTTPVTPVAPPVSPVVQPATPFTLTATNKLATIQNIFAKGGYLQAISEINKLLTTAEKDITAKTAKVNLSDAVDLLVAIRDSAEKQVASLTPLRAFLAHHDFYEGPIANATKAQAEQGLRDKFNPNNKTANALVQRAKKLHAQITGGGAAPTPVGPVIPMPVFGKKLAMQTIQIKEVPEKGKKEKTKVAQIKADQLVKHLDNILSKFEKEIDVPSIPYLGKKISLLKDFKKLLEKAKDTDAFEKTREKITDKKELDAFESLLQQRVTALAIILNKLIFALTNPTDTTQTPGIARGSAKDTLFSDYDLILTGGVAPVTAASSGNVKEDIDKLQKRISKFATILKDDKKLKELFAKSTSTALNNYKWAVQRLDDFSNLLSLEVKNDLIDTKIADEQRAELNNIYGRLLPEKPKGSDVQEYINAVTLFELKKAKPNFFVVYEGLLKKYKEEIKKSLVPALPTMPNALIDLISEYVGK